MSRFYLSNNEADAPPAVPYGPLWDVAASTPEGDDRRRFLRLGSGALGEPPGVLGAIGVNAATAAANQDLLIVQYVSTPLLATQTISGTLTGQILAFATFAADHYHIQVCARVVSGDGLTVRGVLYDGDLREDNRTNEFPVGFWQSRQIPAAGSGGVPLDSVAAQEGDRVVVELGVRREPSGAASAGGAIFNPRSDHVATPEDIADFTDSHDLPYLGNSIQDNRNSWIEFSAFIPVATLSNPEPPDEPPDGPPEDPDAPPDVPFDPDAPLPAVPASGSASVFDLVREFSGQVRRPVRLIGLAAIEMVDLSTPLPSGWTAADGHVLYHASETATAGGAKVMDFRPNRMSVTGSASLVTNDVRLVTSSWRIPERLPVHAFPANPQPVKRITLTFTPKTFRGAVEYAFTEVPASVWR